MRLPSGAALRASIDLSAVDTPIMKPLLRVFERELEELGVPKGSSGVLAALGIDGSRPMSVALVGLGEEPRRRIEALRPSFDKKTPGAWRQGKQVLEDARWIVVQRLLVPVTDSGRFTKKLDAILIKGGAHADGDGLYLGRESVIRVASDGHTVSIDNMASYSPTAREALADLDALIRSGADAPAMEGKQLRVVYSPSGIADIGFALSSVITFGAISGDSVTPAHKEGIGAEGALESAENFWLARTASGTYFDEVDLRVGLGPSKLEVDVRAMPGPGFRGPPDGAWDMTPSIEAPGTWPKLDVARGFGQGWALPGESPERGGSAGFFQMVREAGLIFGMVSALPHACLYGARSYENADALVVTARAANLDRVGTLASGRDTVVFGVLPSAATKADAQKAVAALAAAAAKTHDSKPTVPKASAKTPAAGDELKASSVLEVDHRWVVLLAKDRASLPRSVTLVKRGPFVVGLSPPDLAATIGLTELGPWGLPARMTGTVTRDGKAVVIHLAAP